MEGATLNIRFIDESAGGKGPSVTPIQGSQGDGSSSVQQTQDAITQAGGVGNFVNTDTTPQSLPSTQPVPSPSTFQVPSTSSLPVPPVSTTTTGSDPLLGTVSKIVQADPQVTVDEIAKALGIKLSQAQSLYNQVIGVGVPPSPTPSVPTPSVPPASTSPPPVPPVGPVTPPVPPPPSNLVPPALPPTPPPIGVTPPPLPTVPTANPLASPTAQGVQNTVQALTQIAGQGGPLAAAVGGIANAAANVPGVASAVGAAVPGLAMAAPYVALAGAAIAVPAAAAYTMEQIYQTARGQLQGLDPRVAQAEAEANIRQIIANFRTSRILGDEIAEGVEISSRRSAALQGLRDSFSEVPLQRLNDAATGLNRILEGLDKFFGEGAGRLAAQGISGGAYNAGLMLMFGGLGGAAIMGLQGLGASAPKEPVDPVEPWANRPMPPLPFPFDKGPIKLDRSLSEHGRPGF